LLIAPGNAADRESGDLQCCNIKVRSWEYGKQLKQPLVAAHLRRLTHEGSAQLTNWRYRHRSWITLSEARALFSPMDYRYAFGEMDEVGKMSLAAFAAESDHRSAFDLMPVEGRVYFTRKAP